MAGIPSNEAMIAICCISFFTIVMLGFFARRNRKQGWHRERYEYLQDNVAELEYAVQSSRRNSRTRISQSGQRFPSDRTAEAAVRFLLRAIRESAPAEVLVTESIGSDLRALENLVGEVNIFTLTTRCAAVLSIYQRGIAIQLEQAATDAAAQARAALNATRALSLLSQYVDGQELEAGVRERIDNLGQQMSHLTVGREREPVNLSWQNVAEVRL